MPLKQWLPRAAALIVLLIGFNLHGANAQTQPPNDFQFFRAGGRNDHIILYPLGSEVERDNVTAGLDEAVLYYQALWGGGDRLEFQIAVGFLNRTHTDDPTIYADAVYAPNSEAEFLRGYETGLTIEPSVCAIEIYTPYSADPGRLSTIAHELAHCYQYFYQIAQVNRGFVRDTMKWWVEGSADWFASIVYPLQFPGERQSDFTYYYDVMTRAYDNLYWFAFLASPQGLGSPEAVLTFLRSLPPDPRQYAAAVSRMSPGENVIELFHRWAFALLDGTAPLNPPVSFTRVPKVNAGSPSSRQFTTERFSVDYAMFAGFKTDPGNQAFLQVDGIALGHYGVSVRAGGRDYRLQNGAPYLFCPGADGAVLIFSRGNAGRDDITPFTVTWGQAPSDTPCVAEVEESNAECILGEWQVIAFPPSIATADGVSLDTSESIFTFGANGGVTGSYDIIARADGMTIDLDFPISGTFAIRMTESNPTLFDVLSWEWTFESGGRYIVTNRDGVETNFTDQFYSMGGIELWAPDGVISCDEDMLSWQTADGLGSFVLQRQ